MPEYAHVADIFGVERAIAITQAADKGAACFFAQNVTAGRNESFQDEIGQNAVTVGVGQRDFKRLALDGVFVSDEKNSVRCPEADEFGA